jgi:ABC-type polysaccharide/polyol phosphate transport system ATPase subunit
MKVVELNNVSKRFKRHTGRKLIRERIGDVFKHSEAEMFYALRHVSFRIRDGESVALIGANGAGKSTTLSIIAGLVQPDEGSVEVQGRVAALLELGSGFHPDLTGRENILLNAALLGMSEREAKSQLGSIHDFSELSNFIDEPLRTYSSGMVVRLAFSVAVHVNPKLLIIDEILGVGDAHFQEKCVHRVSQLLREGKTLICVSHSPTSVKMFCNRAVWLHRGEVVMDGEAGKTLQSYLDFACSEDAIDPVAARV